MIPRKQTPPPSDHPWTRTDSYSKVKETHQPTFNITPQFRYTLLLSTFLSLWFLLHLFWNPPPNNAVSFETQHPLSTHDHHHHQITQQPPIKPTCDDAVSVFVYELPLRFNLGLLNDCRHLNIYTNMCPHVENNGLGQPLTENKTANSWFATHQFIAEMIVHARLENHPCRTRNPNEADLFYVPFYGGLHASSKFREADHAVRDALAVDLADHVQSQRWWKRHNGKDHFLVLGRTAWDFMRAEGGPDFGANTLLKLPPVYNMSVLTVERHPWEGSNQYGIPYPSYFHPSTFLELATWQKKMRQSKRPYLFSFAGAPRKDLEKAAIRDEIIRQCALSRLCNLLKCGSGASKCHEPSEVLSVMTKSVFCLQAPGDSFTRRSTFDSVLAGCIPVFFSPHTAYTQYRWHFPEDAAVYSVYIDEKGEGSKRIEEELLKIPREEVERKRNVVISLIPKVTYAHPNASDVGFKDAVDVTLVELHRLLHSKLGSHESTASE